MSDYVWVPMWAVMFDKNHDQRNVKIKTESALLWISNCFKVSFEYRIILREPFVFKNLYWSMGFFVILGYQNLLALSVIVILCQWSLYIDMRSICQRILDHLLFKGICFLEPLMFELWPFHFKLWCPDMFDVRHIEVDSNHLVSSTSFVYQRLLLINIGNKAVDILVDNQINYGYVC